MEHITSKCIYLYENECAYFRQTISLKSRTYEAFLRQYLYTQHIADEIYVIFIFYNLRCYAASFYIFFGCYTENKY